MPSSTKGLATRTADGPASSSNAQHVESIGLVVGVSVTGLAEEAFPVETEASVSSRASWKRREQSVKACNLSQTSDSWLDGCGSYLFGEHFVDCAATSAGAHRCHSSRFAPRFGWIGLHKVHLTACPQRHRLHPQQRKNNSVLLECTQQKTSCPPTAGERKSLLAV
jgi:hypothetical protein